MEQWADLNFSGSIVDRFKAKTLEANASFSITQKQAKDLERKILFITGLIFCQNIFSKRYMKDVCK